MCKFLEDTFGLKITISDMDKQVISHNVFILKTFFKASYQKVSVLTFSCNSTETKQKSLFYI